MIHQPSSKPHIPIITGVLTVGRGCQWFGKAILHQKDTCECQNIPEDYVQVASDGAPFTVDLVGIVRDIKLAPRRSVKITKKQIANIKIDYLYVFQCRHCWPKRRIFKTEISAIDHLSSYHGVSTTTRITEIMRDVIEQKAKPQI